MAARTAFVIKYHNNIPVESKIDNLVTPFLCACLELHCRVVPVSERVEGGPPVYWVQLRQFNSDKDFAAVLVEKGLAQYNSGIILFEFNPR